MRRFNHPESNAHSRRPHIGHEPESHESRAAVIDPDADFGAVRKRRGRLDKASEYAQIACDRGNLPFRFHVHDFHPSCERAPHRAMLLHLHSLQYETSSRFGPANSRWMCRFFNILRASGGSVLIETLRDARPACPGRPLPYFCNEKNPGRILEAKTRGSRNFRSRDSPGALLTTLILALIPARFGTPSASDRRRLRCGLLGTPHASRNAARQQSSEALADLLHRFQQFRQAF